MRVKGEDQGTGRGQGEGGSLGSGVGLQAPSKPSRGDAAIEDARSPPARKPSSWPSSATGLTRLPAMVFELPG